jgi:hypothetical protein
MDHHHDPRQVAHLAAILLGGDPRGLQAHDPPRYVKAAIEILDEADRQCEPPAQEQASQEEASQEPASQEPAGAA